MMAPIGGSNKGGSNDGGSKRTRPTKLPTCALIRIGLRGALPTLAAAGETTAGARLRIYAHAVIRVRVDDVLITQAVAVGVDKSHRLLKQARLRITLGHRAFEDIKLVLVHRDVGERPRFIGIGELQEIPFDHVLPFPREAGDLGRLLNQFECRIHDAAAFVMSPVAGPHDARVLTALLVAFLAGLRAFDALLLDRPIVDHRHRVALLALLDAVNLAWKNVVKLRLPGDVGDLRRAGKVDLESVLLADELLPLLGSGTAND